MRIALEPAEALLQRLGEPRVQLLLAHAADPITSESDPLDDLEDEDAVPGED